MEQKKSFLQGCEVGRVLAVPAAVFAVLAVLFYQKTGVTEFSPSLYPSAIVTAWAAAAVSALSLVLNRKAVKYAAYLLALYSFMQYITSQVTYIANIFVSIDGSTFSSGMILTVLFYALAIVFLLAAAITAHLRLGGKEEE